MPDSVFKRWWCFIMVVLLLYVATYVPYNICFNFDLIKSQNERWGFIEYLDILVDIIFICDMIVTFMSAYEDTTTGLIVTDHKLIAKHYLKGWFALDLLACIPVDLIEGFFEKSKNGQNLKLVRLVRLPRLFKLMRILRVLKTLRVIKQYFALYELIGALNISAGIIRMV